MKKYKIAGGCTLCGMCLYECPAKAISMTENGAVIDSGKCAGCGRCFDNCASEAIRAYECEERRKQA